MPKRTYGHDITLGHVADTGQPLRFSREDRAMHCYIPGSTGVGKSKLMEHMIREHLREAKTHGCGAIVLDPHGSLYDSTLRWCAKHRLDRKIVPIDLRRDDQLIGYNLLRRRPSASPSVVIDALVQAMAYVWGASGTDRTPLLARWASNVFTALYEKGLTLVEAIPLLDDPAVRASLTSGLVDRMTNRDWKLAEDLSRKDLEAQLGSTINRLQRFLRNESMRMIFGQSESSLDLRSALDDGSIILVSLATEGGRISKENADLFGTLLLTDLVESARERGKRDGLRPFYVFMDEAQRFVTPSIAESLDEARGFGLHFTLANQYPAQFLARGESGRQLHNSIMENASSKAVFRLNDEANLRPLANWLYMGVMNPDEIKHELYSTKVMGYREEIKVTRSRNESRSSGGGSSSSRSRGKGAGRNVPLSKVDDIEAGTESTHEQDDEASGENQSWSESEGWSESEQTVLVPELGKELSSIQYRSLEEQMHRSMAALFDQQRRECVVRLVGTKVPVSIRIPYVSPAHISAERVERYRNELLARLPYAVAKSLALHRLVAREDSILVEAAGNAADGELAVTFRRKIG